MGKRKRDAVRQAEVESMALRGILTDVHSLGGDIEEFVRGQNVLLDQSGERMSSILHVAERAVAYANESTDLAKRLVSRLDTVPTDVGGNALSAKELEIVARRLPQWSIASGVIDGKAAKHYRRDFGDMYLRRYNERDTYMRFFDGEYPDAAICEIFGVHGITGDAGTSAYIQIDGAPGPITVHDIDMVSKAEFYLINAGYVPSLSDSIPA